MDVTQGIQQSYIVYGASDYTAPGGLAASKSLNYAKGPTINNPDRNSISVVPSTLRYADSVGLFGAENYYLRVDLDISSSIVKACFEEDGWSCAKINYLFIETDNNYSSAAIDDSDFPVENSYEQADVINTGLPVLDNGYISIDLKNIKSGNRFLDDWLDIRLYTQDKEEHPYDKMYIKLKGSFYIGVHARNTKRLPYDILCDIGQEYRSYESIKDKNLIMRQGLR